MATQRTGSAYMPLIKAIHEVEPGVMDVKFDGSRDTLPTISVTFHLTEEVLAAWGRRIAVEAKPEG